MDSISRRKLAKYVAGNASNGTVPREIVSQVAGFLRATGRVREAELVARAIEDELAERGEVVTDVTSAYPLTLDEKMTIQQLLSAETVYFREAVDPGVIGGVRIKTPAATLDATIANKLHALQRAKL